MHNRINPHHATRTHGGLSGTISDYVKTHCATCAAGWTRTGEDGVKVYVCLLDREPVWPQMIECDRYEKREEPTTKPES